jgi:hypothetical protein
VKFEKFVHVVGQDANPGGIRFSICWTDGVKNGFPQLDADPLVLIIVDAFCYKK